ncbi:hypothetical protein LCGC14_1287360 [marine sediment metagenome]|uniref:DUF2933 domain-containing protein n=2 Tax=root TaxID=1 RepID=A0A831W2J6_9GAMM|nr:DUF2933 domain-containing protein [Marinobacter antarcticus]HEA53117.1 DUF2933 domain-containing protein [Marinobacter antarcticus]
MEWLAENWIWLLVGIAFVGLHLFGHGGHGGHGGHDDKKRPNPSSRNESKEDESGSHRH